MLDRKGKEKNSNTLLFETAILKTTSLKAEKALEISIKMVLTDML
jgi:hypothetical protein